MNLSRCDDCCDVLDGVDGGVVYECDQDVYSENGTEHLCVLCMTGNDDVYLDVDGIINLVKLKELKNGKIHVE